MADQNVGVIEIVNLSKKVKSDEVCLVSTLTNNNWLMCEIHHL